MKRSAEKIAVSWAVLCVLLWGIGLSLWGSLKAPAASTATAFSQRTHPDHASEAEEHARYCRCLNCPGIKKCCCKSPEGVAGSFILRSLCDDGISLTVAFAAGVALRPLALAAPTPFLMPVIETSSPLPPADSPGRRPNPPHSPPRIALS